MTEFYVLTHNGGTCYVKDGDYFRSQGGLVESWGHTWQRFDAEDAAGALIQAHERIGTKCPQYKIDYYRAADRAIAEGRDPQAAADAASMKDTAP